MAKIPSRPLLPAAAAALVLAATATLAVADPAATERRLTALGYVRGDPVQILPQDVIDHWDYLDDRTVVVHSGAGGHYLVSLGADCPALQSASVISFNAAITGGLVESGALIVGASASAPECSISQIVRLDRRPAR